MTIRYEVTYGNEAPRIITPFSGNDLSLKWDREDLPKYDFKKEVTEITLVKQDFAHFLALEQSNDNCELQTLRIISNCGFQSQDVILYEGTFTMSSGKWDLDKCTVKFKIEQEDPYKCFEEDDTEYNILDFVLPRTVNLGVTIVTDYIICGTFSEIDCSDEALEEGLWTFNFEQTIQFEGSIFYYKVYIRNKITVPCGFYPGDDWTLISACSGGNEIYVKRDDSERPPIGEFQVLDNGLQIVLDYENITAASNIDNGRKLLQVMETLLDKSCFNEGKNIVSDFFQWNPENQTNINYVTNEINQYSNLVIFQKSDVKRPLASGNATKAELNFNDILENVCNMFNCAYRFIDGNLRIEHISYFQSNLGLNLATPDNERKFLKGTRKYAYDETQLPKFEKFKFMDSGTLDFDGVDIIYDSNCVNNKEENRKEITIDNITTDVMTCIQNPSSDSEVVSDDGFVIIACDANYNVLYDDGILDSGTTINNVVGWAHLHDKLFRHGRVLKFGNLNQQDVEFETINPTIKQDQFSVILKCNQINSFDPLDQIKASLGWGYLQSGELKLSTCSMSFDLMLENIQGVNYEFEYGDFDSDFDEDFD